MKKHIFLIIIFQLLLNNLFSQPVERDTLPEVKLGEIIIQSNRAPFALKNNPGSVSIVNQKVIALMPKGIGAEEALHLVPGVRIDNQHDAERVHVSIRGQGILTERGLRGIGVVIDGIPLNDPSGFAPDLYDIDWSTVNKIEVLRGPAAGLYGGGGAAGVIHITTNNGGERPVGGAFSQTVGSNGFSKSLLQVDGRNQLLDYRVSYSHAFGDGYRDHQGFWSNKLYEKMNFNFSPKFTVNQVISHTGYFQQNPEGLNLGQFNNLRQANPDACPFNEYQKTQRTTIGLHANYIINAHHSFEATSYLRSWNYKETSNRCAEYRTISNPGVNLQYILNFKAGSSQNILSAGYDGKWQSIGMYKIQSAVNPLREESMDETNLETGLLLANQLIDQQSNGIFALYKFNLNRFNLLGNMRYDVMGNELTDKMVGVDSSKTTKNFSKVSLRLGASYCFIDAITLFANWSQGFMPPSTEELASNPVGYSGFNTHLVPAVSNSYEFGLRGFLAGRINYDLTGFIMKTKDDFFRFKQSGRGNQEVFYGNAGNSNRYGLEFSGSIKLLKKIQFDVAYTYSRFKYTSATIDAVYTDTNYVLTSPPAKGQWLPNSPEHQLDLELNYQITQNLALSVSSEFQSKWAIYTDAKAYSGLLDPSVYQNWQDGFTILNARLAYNWELWKIKGECSLFARNLTGEKYIAFTEPDPDGNSYQPGPRQEYFAMIKIKF